MFAYMSAYDKVNSQITPKFPVYSSYFPWNVSNVVYSWNFATLIKSHLII